MKTLHSSYLGTLLLLTTMVLSCTPTPPPITCNSLIADQIVFGSINYNISYKNSLIWGVHCYKIQLNGQNGSDNVSPEIIIYDGTTTGVPEVGTYNFTSNYLDLADTTSTANCFTFVASYTGLYDYMPDTASVNIFEITNVSGNNVSGCLTGKVSNGSNTRDLKLKFLDIPF